ncbi:MAG: hypothetical protein EA427_04070 [Spirochaetaceae bacterium]|nr:MAG: hypothetical protein EA427_04070 [Spirochaetaceae bacterium]
MKTVKLFLPLLLLPLLLLTLTGCLEVVQHVGAGPDDSLENYVRVTLQRSIFAFAEAFGGEAMSDDDFAREFGMTESEVLQDIPEGVSARFEQVITDYDYGFALRTTTARAFQTNEAPLIPFVRGNELLIPLPAGDEDGMDEAAFFLASAKYRIILDKSIWPVVRSAHVLGAGGEPAPIDVTEFRSVWLLEFPVILWLGGGESPLVVIRG